MAGFFIISSNQTDESFDIKCELNSDFASETVPEKQQELYVEIESTNNIIKSLHKTKNDVKKIYFNKLLSLSQAGLVGETAQPELALKSLAQLRNEMLLVEGQRIKNNYMKNLGAKALLLSSVALLAYFLSLAYKPFSPLSMYCLTIIGAFIGTWISFGARKFRITFEQLSLLEEDMMNPWIRLLYIGACSAVFLLFLNTGLLSFSVGNISTSSIKTSSELQLSIGILCGLVESKIGINIYKKAVTLIPNS